MTPCHAPPGAALARSQCLSRDSNLPANQRPTAPTFARDAIPTRRACTMHAATSSGLTDAHGSPFHPSNMVLRQASRQISAKTPSRRDYAVHPRIGVYKPPCQPTPRKPTVASGFGESPAERLSVAIRRDGGRECRLADRWRSNNTRTADRVVSGYCPGLSV